MGQSSDIFVRKATGLSKDVGFMGAALFGVTQAVPVLSAPWILIFCLQFFSAGDYLVGGLIGMIGSIIVGMVYANFVAAMPRAGGEYVFLSRTVYPLLGFVINWISVFTMCFWWSTDMWWVTMLTHRLLSTFMLPASVDWLILQPQGLFIMGALFLSGNALLAIIGIKRYMWVQALAWILGGLVSGIIVIYYFLGSASNFPAIFNSWMQQQTGKSDVYNLIINQASATGFHVPNPPSRYWFDTFGVSVLFATMLLPFTLYQVYIAGEMKRAESYNRQVWSIVLNIVIYMVATWAIIFPFLQMAGVPFSAAYSIVWNVPGLAFQPYYFSFIAIVAPPIVAFVYYVGLYVMTFAAETTKPVSGSRCMLAWTFDRLMPSKLADVSDRFKTPHVAIALMWIIAFAFVYFGLYLAGFLTVAAASFVYIFFQLILICAAGMLLPYLRKELYEKMPSKRKIAGIPLMAIVGLAGLIFNIAWLSFFFMASDFQRTYGALTPFTAEITVLLYGSAIVVFYGAKYLRKRQGIDISLAFKQIPPA